MKRVLLVAFAALLRRVGLRAAATRAEIQSQGSAVGHDARHGADPHRHAEIPRRPARHRHREEGLRQPRLRSRRGSLPAGHSGGQCPGPATGLHRRRLPAEPGLRHLRGPGGRPLAVPDPEHGRGLYLGDHRRQGRADGAAGAARRAGHPRRRPLPLRHRPRADRARPGQGRQIPGGAAGLQGHAAQARATSSRRPAPTATSSSCAPSSRAATLRPS